jgi:hypothetical protein
MIFAAAELVGMASDDDDDEEASGSRRSVSSDDSLISTLLPDKHSTVQAITSERERSEMIL